MTSPNPSPAFAVSTGVLLVGTAGYGVWRVARLWAERERSATGYVAGKAFTIMVVGIDGRAAPRQVWLDGDRVLAQRELPALRVVAAGCERRVAHQFFHERPALQALQGAFAPGTG